MRHFIRIIMFVMLGAGAAHAEPQEYSSPDLRPVKVRDERPMGRILIHANFSSHRIIVDGAEYPAYLADRGIEVTSNELHEVRVTNSAGAKKKYRLSVNPNETLMLYVDLGNTAPRVSAAPPAQEQKEEKEEKKEDADVGYLSITAESEAQIYIDGKLVASKTPLTKREVSVGSHTVRVYFFDTRKFSKSREIYVGKGATMSLSFTKK